MMQDGQELIECPYNKSHRIRRERFQVHLGRCRRQHPNVKKMACPFNVTHILNEPEMNWHVEECPQRSSYEKYKHVDESYPTTSTSDTTLDSHPGLNNETLDEEEEVPTYNPQAYVQNARVLRNLQGVSPGLKREFRQKERFRHLGIKKSDKS